MSLAEVCRVLRLFPPEIRLGVLADAVDIVLGSELPEGHFPSSQTERDREKPAENSASEQVRVVASEPKDDKDRRHRSKDK